MERSTTPQVTRAIRSFPLEDGRGEVAAGDPVLILGAVEDQLLCFAGGDLLFRATRDEVSRSLAPAGPEDRLPEGASENRAMGLVLSLLIAGCAGLNAAEAGSAGGIESFGDALWYGINTISTVGVGDVAPETPLGKLIASGLMVLGNPLYAKFGEELVAPLLGGGRSGVNAVAEQVDRVLRATS